MLGVRVNSHMINDTKNAGTLTVNEMRWHFFFQITACHQLNEDTLVVATEMSV